MTTRAWGVALACSLLFAACGSKTPPPATRPDASPPGGSILFIAEGPEGTPDIYRATIGGGNPQQLTHGVGASYPVQMANGSLLFNVIDEQAPLAITAYTATRDGGNTEVIGELPTPTMTPRPSPTDPETLVFAASTVTGDPTSGLAIRTQDLATGDEAEVAAGGAFAFPDWSPDGESVVFQKHTDDRDQLFTARLGEERSALTQLGYMDTNAVWSPDGEWIAFASSRGESPDCADTPEDPCLLTIYLIRPDGTGLRQLTSCDGSPYCGTPAWSPDGRWVAYVRADVVSGGFSSEIVATPVEGSSTVTLVDSGLSPSMPSWYPAEEAVAP